MILALLQDAADAASDAGGFSPEDLGPVQFIVAIGFFLFLGLIVLRPARRLESWAVGPAHPAPQIYQAGDLLAVVGLFVLVQIAFFAAYAFLTGAVDRGPDEPPPELSFVETIWAGLATFGLMSAYVLIVSVTRKGGPAALGLRPRAPRRVPFGHTFASVARYLASAPLLLALTSGIGLAYHLAGSEPPAQEVAVDIQENLEQHLLLVVLFAVVLQPLFEEILFRGFLLELGVARFGVPLAILVTSLLFGLAHGAAAAPVTAFLGAVFAWIKLRTGSLWAPFLAHALHNGSQILLAAYALDLPTPE
ncbi:MAG: type II CAAX endopeptidase family protein [Planctomycetota bacterium]